jgi:hypothetical protein
MQLDRLETETTEVELSEYAYDFCSVFSIEVAKRVLFAINKTAYSDVQYYALESLLKEIDTCDASSIYTNNLLGKNARISLSQKLAELDSSKGVTTYKMLYLIAVILYLNRNFKKKEFIVLKNEDTWAPWFWLVVLNYMLSDSNFILNLIISSIGFSGLKVAEKVIETKKIGQVSGLILEVNAAYQRMGLDFESMGLSANEQTFSEFWDRINQLAVEFRIDMNQVMQGICEQNISNCRVEYSSSIGLNNIESLARLQEEIDYYNLMLALSKNPDFKPEVFAV